MDHSSFGNEVDYREDIMKPSSNSITPELNKLKMFLVNSVSRELETRVYDLSVRDAVVRQTLQDVIANTKLQLPNTIRDQLTHDILNELLGFGPLQQLLDDPEISEIMVNGAKKVYIERKGMLIKTNVTFDDDSQVLRIIDRIILPIGRRIDTDSPTVDARLPDGSRVNATIPPVAIDGPTITIRKFNKGKLSIDQLIDSGTLTKQMADLLRACVVSHMNIIISGGTGSGKTTLLNALSSFLPEDERIITIEDAAELKLQQDHVLRLETKAPNIEGKNAVTLRELVRNSLRMRPDRIVVGEVRGGEALDMLQALNTGHDGSLTTLHANTPRDAISRLETMCLMSGMDLPMRALREQIASAIDLIIQIARLRDGSRKVTYITEVSGMEGDMITMTDIFKFEQTGVDKEGKILGMIKPTGIRPLFSPRLEASGFKLSPDVFGANLADMLGQRR
jgi:pilus assembly protein CpaF